MAASDEDDLWLKIATLKDLQAHDQTSFNLVDIANVQSQRLKKTEFINAFKTRAANFFGVPVERQQYWVWTRRQTDTIRPLRTLTAEELAQDVRSLVPLQALGKENHPTLLLVDANPDPETGVPPSIDESPISGLALVFFKFYDPDASKVAFVGHALISLQNASTETVELCFRELAGDLLVPVDAKLNAWKEGASKSLILIDSDCNDVVVNTGDVFVLMIEQPDPMAHPFPTPVDWYSHKANRLMIEFRSLDAPEDENQYFSIECHRNAKYAEVQAAVGKKLGADPAKIRFTSSSPTAIAPRQLPCERDQDLFGMIRWHNFVTHDILYYEVLPAPLDEIEQMKCIKIEYQMANMRPLKLIRLWVPRQGVVRDIFPYLQQVQEVKEVLESDPAEGHTTGTRIYRIMEVCNSRVAKIWEGANPLTRLDEITKCRKPIPKKPLSMLRSISSSLCFTSQRQQTRRSGHTGPLSSWSLARPSFSPPSGLAFKANS